MPPPRAGSGEKTTLTTSTTTTTSRKRRRRRKEEESEINDRQKWRSLEAGKDDLSLDRTLPTGQSFRWQKVRDDDDEGTWEKCRYATYVGVIGRRVVKIRERVEDAAVEEAPNVEITASETIDQQPAEEAPRTLTDFAELAAVATGTTAPDRPLEETSSEPKIDERGRSYATGRRKDAVARVWIKPGPGKMVINGREIEIYFARPTQQMMIKQPFEVAGRANQYDVICTVSGGGLSGQAGAVRHGISPALAGYEPDLRSTLKKGGFLTRDSRTVERKKYGRAKARRSFQFSKR